MIRKLFGETEVEQYTYLKSRLTALLTGLVFLMIGACLQGIGLSLGNLIAKIGTVVTVIVLIMFGWCLVRAVSGVASAGMMFSNNPIIAIVILVLLLMVGYIGGMVVALIGACRFLALLKKRKTGN